MVKRVFALIGTSLLMALTVDSFSVSQTRSTRTSVARNAFTSFVEPEQGKKRDKQTLSAVSDVSSSSSSTSTGSTTTESDNPFLENSRDSLLPVLSASLLLTGNTIGAGCLVLPDVAAGPGFGPSAGIFLTAYVLNWISGLVIAEVAITQKQKSVQDSACSFKGLAKDTLGSTAATAVSAISLFVNTCCLSFDMSRIGPIGLEALHLQESSSMGPVMTLIWAGMLATMTATQSNASLSNIASLCVTTLFLSFGSLLLPGLVHVADPMGTLLQPGTQGLDAIASTAPVILMAMVYQNIVPSITKLLDYDWNKTFCAITFGSALPLCLYVAWCFACMGGGIDRSVGVGGEIMTLFSLVTLAGSSLGSVMSLSEEIGTYVPASLWNEVSTDSVTTTDDVDNDAYTTTKGGYGLASVLLSIMIPLTANLALGEGVDFTPALAVAGSFGSPLLYGVFPALMAWKQRQEATTKSVSSNSSNDLNMIPAAGLPLLGILSSSFVGEELLNRVGEVMS